MSSNTTRTAEKKLAEPSPKAAKVPATKPAGGGGAPKGAAGPKGDPGADKKKGCCG